MLLRFLLLACLVAAQSAQALVDARTMENTSNPGTGVPWGNIGALHGASGNYLGNGWVLTAAHVGPGTIVFDIGTFEWDGVSAVQLTNPDGSPADMILFRLTTEPALPPLTLSTVTPLLNSQVEMVGYGRIRGSEEKTYTLTSGNTVRGFDWSANPAKSWGTNRVSSALPSMVLNTMSFTTDFSGQGPFTGRTTDEAQAALGDSGGGIFVRNGATWELAGMMYLVGTLSGQPAETAVYGNLTYAADIATYKPQIDAVLVVPEPGSAALFAGGVLVLLARRRRSAK